MRPTSEGDLIVETPWRQRWLPVALGVGMTAVCLWLDLQVHAGVFRYAGVPGLVFFPPCLAYAVYRAVRPRPAVVLSVEGFTDRASALAVGFVPWEEVATIGTVAAAGQTLVAVKLRQPSVVIRRLRMWKRVVIAINQRLRPGDVFMPASFLPTSASAFAETREEWRLRRCQ